MFVDKFLERNVYFFFDCVGVVDVIVDVEEFGVLVVFMVEVGELVVIVMVDGRGNSNSFDVGNSGRVIEKIDSGRERRF